MDFQQLFSGKIFRDLLTINIDFRKNSGLADGIGFLADFCYNFVSQIQKQETMDKIFKLSVAFALALFVGGKAFGQEWEFADEFSYSSNECMTNFDATELSDGTIAVSSV